MNVPTRAPIVFIDDEPLLCRVFALALKRFGREVVTFTDPVAAVAHLTTSARPCVVICDFNMPKLTGLEVLQQLPDDLPFILISGDLAAADQVTLGRGVTAFIRKPMSPEELFKVITPWVQAVG
jgi:CheY-like chemotaxis protein